MSRWIGPRIRATKVPQQYPYMQYPYQNVGTQLAWRDSAPYQSKAAPGSLGSYLPVPGGAEEIPIESGYSGTDCGCGCKGAGTCKGVGDAGVPAGPIGTVLEKYVQVPGKVVLQAVTGTEQGFVANIAVTAGLGLLLYKVMKRR